MTLDTDNHSFYTKVSERFANIVRQAGPYMTASYALIGAVLGLTLLGYFIDEKLGTSPWMLTIGIVLGLVIGLYEIAKVSFKK